jgi:zinc protease
VPLNGRKYLTLEDDVHLPRLYFTWHSPAMFAPDDAELDVVSGILAQGKTARLYKSLVYDKRVAQDVDALQSSALLSSTFELTITARPNVDLNELAQLVTAEVEQTAKEVAEQEVERAVRRLETSLVDSLQTVGGFGGRADRLNHYAFYAGDPNYVAQDHARYVELDAQGVSAAAEKWLVKQEPVILTVVPRGESANAAREVR